MIPLRHLAPEVLKSSSFSTASDVFSCGVTIWEIINFGKLPFESVGNEEFLQMLQNNSVDYGKLFENDKMPSELQKTLVGRTKSIEMNSFHELKFPHLQINCWNTTTSERPTPENLIKALDALITSENGDTK